jgi:hypothetical protein
LSYLSLPDGIPNFSELVLSVWFRVPQTTIDAAVAAYDPGADPLPPFSGVVPLLTFGTSAVQKRVSAPNIATGSYTTHVMFWINQPTCDWVEGATPTAATGGPQYRFSGEEYAVECSFVGVDCTGDVPVLSVNIQMEDFAAFGGAWPHGVAHAGWNHNEYRPPNIGGDPMCTVVPEIDDDGHVLPFDTWNRTVTYESGAAVVIGNQPEVFRTQPRPRQPTANPDPFGPDLEVTPDHWHHLLFSVDLRDPCDVQGVLLPTPTGEEAVGTLNSACRMWVALDDVNYTERLLSAFWPQDVGANPNAVLTANACQTFMRVMFEDTYSPPPFNDTYGNIVTETGIGITTPTCVYYPPPVPAHNLELGIPASDDYTDSIRHIMLSELQIFTGVHLDTGVESNRRAFIDADGKPVPPSEAEALVGRKPDVLLHGTGNWVHGTNTGLPVSGSVPALTPTGKIDAYTPDPSLHGPQSPPSTPPG